MPSTERVRKVNEARDPGLKKRLRRMVEKPGFKAEPFTVVLLLENPETGELREVRPKKLEHYSEWKVLGMRTITPTDKGGGAS